VSGLVLSLFPGIGLLDMAFEEEGFCVVRGPDVLWGGDVHRFHPPARRFDGVIGGPPCQAFSGLANLSKKERPNLIPEFERCVSEARPSWFVMENVRAAPVPAVVGYKVQEQLVNNRALGDGVGQEQNRVRRISFGTQGGVRLHLRGAALFSPRWSAAVTNAHGGARKTHFNTHTGGKIQRYTVEEALRLQGLPADFYDGRPFRKDACRAMVANGVPLPMGRAIARSVKAALAAHSAEASA